MILSIPFRAVRYCALTAWFGIRFIRYLNGNGYWRSIFTRRCEDRAGNPIPWLTYPAISLLSAFDFRDSTVLEFGSGNSTLWWAGRSRSVTSIETSIDWIARISKLNPPNTYFWHRPEDLSHR